MIDSASTPTASASWRTVPPGSGSRPASTPGSAKSAARARSRLSRSLKVGIQLPSTPGHLAGVLLGAALERPVLLRQPRLGERDGNGLLTVGHLRPFLGAGV